MSTTIHDDKALIEMHLEQAELVAPKNDWETDFLSSIIERLKSGKGLTGKQAEILGKMYNGKR